jgi:hypothetical protein
MTVLVDVWTSSLSILGQDCLIAAGGNSWKSTKCAKSAGIRTLREQWGHRDAQFPADLPDRTSEPLQNDIH